MVRTLTRRDFLRSASLAVAAIPLLSTAATVPVASARPARQSKPDKLSVVLFEPTEAKAAELAGQKFTEQHGIKIEVNAIPWANLKEKIVSDLTTQSGAYDIIFIPGLWGYEFVEAGWIENLAPYIKGEVGGLPPFDIEDYPKSVVDLVSKDGDPYWIPHHASTQILFYRKDLFEKNSLQPPETYDDLFAAAKLFTNNPSYPGLYGFGTTPKQGEWASSMWSTWLWSWGGDYFDEKWKPIFNNEVGVDSLKAFAEIIQNYSPPDSVNWDNDASAAGFAQGLVATLQMWPEAWAPMEDPTQSKVVGNVGYAPMPKKVLRFPRLGSWGGTLNKFGKNKEWAWQWLAYFNSRDVTRNIQVPAGVSIARSSVTADPEVQKQFPWLPAVIVSFEHTKERPGIPEITEIIDVWGLAINSVVTKQKEAKAALDEAAQKIEGILDRAGYYKA